MHANGNILLLHQYVFIILSGLFIIIVEEATINIWHGLYLSIVKLRLKKKRTRRCDEFLLFAKYQLLLCFFFPLLLFTFYLLLLVLLFLLLSFVCFCNRRSIDRYCCKDYKVCKVCFKNFFFVIFWLLMPRA